jgi:AhpD family alkylhydroperoxidase
MAGWFIRRALRRTLSQIRYVTPVDPRRARGRVGAVYRQAERDFGLIAPPLALHSPAPAVLTASWAMLRESLVADGAADRAAKEIVAAGVSEANACPYCVEVHGATLWGLTGTADASAVAAGTPDEVTDPSTRAMLAWAGGTGGWPAGRSDAEAAELMGVAVTFHYLNRMVSVFLGDSPLPPTVPATVRGRARRVLGAIMGRSASGGRPGDSLELFDGPADTAPEWTAGNSAIAAAFGHAAAALDAAPSVPDPVRALVTEQLDEWDGEPVGISRGWVEDAVATLPAADRAAGRLALLTAKAAYQVDEDVVTGFRRTDPSDAALVELTSWAAHTAARRTGDRIWRAPVS